MITTTTITIPNAEITEIISIVHNRVVLGTNLFSDISAGFSDFFGGKNTGYENRLADITNQVIEGLVEKAKKLKADGLVGLKIDVDEISGGNKSMFMVTAIATAVKLNKKAVEGSDNINNSISIETLKLEITRNKIIKDIESGLFSPKDEFIQSFILNNDFPEAFEAYLQWAIKEVKPDNWQDNWQEIFSQYISNLNSNFLFDKTINYFSKEIKNEIENRALKVILQHLVIDYAKVLLILTENDNLEKQRLCLNILYHYNKNYSNDDFDLVSKILNKLKEVFPKKTTQEVVKGIFSGVDLLWVCPCGKKNSLNTIKYCSNCSNDEYGNKVQIRHLTEVESKLEELLSANKSL